MFNSDNEGAEASLDPRIDLAALRTELAWDRTLLAWIRTSLTLMGAGVVLAKGTQLLHRANVLAGVAIVRNGHWVGLTLTGVSTLLFATVCGQYLKSRRVLWRIRGSAVLRFPPALLASALVILVGVAAFVVLILDKG